MKLMTALVVVGGMFLTGCSLEPPLNSGMVVSKRYEPEKKWVQIILIPRITRVGKTSVTTFIPIPMFHRRPEHWTVVIRGAVELESKRRPKQRELYVPRGTYERIAVGDIYTVQATDKAALPVEKHRATSEEKLVYGVQPANPR